MSKGLDCTDTITTEKGKQLISQGYNFVCRYLVPESMAWKRLTKVEAETITSLGLKIISVYESTENRTKGGENAGITDGQAAYKEAKLIGQPEGSCIYFAVDYDAPESDYDTIEAYLRAAKSQIPRYKIGVYGGYAVIEAMANRKACDYFWQTYAWSNGKVSNHANVYQYNNYLQVAGIEADADQSFVENGCWDTNTKSKQQLSDYKTIINLVAKSPEAWDKFIETAENASSKVNLGDLAIFKFFPQLIVKIYNIGLTLGKEEDWKVILSKVVQSLDAWIKGIESGVNAAKSDGSLGDLEMAQYLPQLIVKIFNYGK